MKFQMVAGFPSNGFTNRLLTELELNYTGNIRYTVRRLFSQLKAVTGPKFSYDWEGEDCLVIEPATFSDCLLFVGLDVGEAIVNESLLVRDGKTLYYYEDRALKKRPDMGYEISYVVGPDNRLKLGYGGPLFREYREKVAWELS
jgi:hypothetical protein